MTPDQDTLERLQARVQIILARQAGIFAAADRHWFRVGVAMAAIDDDGSAMQVWPIYCPEKDSHDIDIAQKLYLWAMTYCPKEVAELRQLFHTGGLEVLQAFIGTPDAA